MSKMRALKIANRMLRSSTVLAGVSCNRAQFFLDVPSGPFYGSDGRTQRFSRRLSAPVVTGIMAPMRITQALSVNQDRPDQRPRRHHDANARSARGEDQIVPIGESARKSIASSRLEPCKHIPAIRTACR
jgi:hypothetical protein